MLGAALGAALGAGAVVATTDGAVVVVGATVGAIVAGTVGDGNTADGAAVPAAVQPVMRISTEDSWSIRDMANLGGGGRDAEAIVDGLAGRCIGSEVRCA